MSKYIGIVRFDENTTRNIDKSPLIIEAAKEVAKKIIQINKSQWESIHLILPGHFIRTVADVTDKDLLSQSLRSFSTLGTISEVSFISEEESGSEKEDAPEKMACCPQCGSTIKSFAPRHPPNIIGYSGREEDAQWGNPHAGLMVECLIEDRFICTNLLCNYQQTMHDWIWVWHAD